MDEDAWIHPEDLRLLIKLVRLRRNWTQEEMAAACGVSDSSIYEYEKGFVPPKKTLEKILAAAGHPLDLVQVSLLPGLATLRHHDRWQRLDPAEPEMTLEAWGATVADVLRSARASLVFSEREEAVPPTLEEQREAAGPLCETLLRATPFERQVLVTRVPAFRSRAVVERLRLESEAAGSHDADLAMELAELARKAETMPPAGGAR